ILAEKKSGEGCDYLVLVEHPNVFTIGRKGSEDHILADRYFIKNEGLKILHTDRGGDITFHGIGQVVAYPIFDLRNHTKDVRVFIRQLERVITMTLKGYGIDTDGNSSHTGIWAEGSKIGFIGIGFSNWITYHGLSLNANVDLRYFSMIRPCGIEGVTVTSIKKILKRPVEIDSLKQLVIEKFCEVFNFGECCNSKNAAVAFAAASAAGSK
ncbi:MAG: lipoyl(octanoyl) transferase LipB, partial [Candidatus Omnitrophota bacterium]|nr:lipoyl(octanoyl) transferase LipB [Candidatus Omnitrophota bacterium]